MRKLALDEIGELVKVVLYLLHNIVNEKHECSSIEVREKVPCFNDRPAHDSIHPLHLIHYWVKKLAMAELIKMKPDPDHGNHRKQRYKKDYGRNKHYFSSAEKRANFPISIFSPNFWIAFEIKSAMV